MVQKPYRQHPRQPGTKTVPAGSTETVPTRYGKCTAGGTETVPANRTAPHDCAVADEHPSRGTKTVPPHNGGDDDEGGYPEYIHENNSGTVAPHHHPHDPDLVRKLVSYGFLDAPVFAARYERERILRAIVLVEATEDVKKKGAMIRKLVKTPGAIPSPRNKYTSGMFGHLVRQ